MTKNIFLPVAVLLSVLCLTAGCKKSSSGSDTPYLNAKVNGQPYNDNSCWLYLDGNFAIVDGYTLNKSAGDPNPIYPRLQLRLWKFSFVPGTYTLSSGDSTTALYFATERDTVEAASGTIQVIWISPVTGGGIKGKFNLILKDGTSITDGTFLTGPYAWIL